MHKGHLQNQCYKRAMVRLKAIEGREMSPMKTAIRVLENLLKGLEAGKYLIYIRKNSGEIDKHTLA